MIHRLFNIFLAYLVFVSRSDRDILFPQKCGWGVSGVVFAAGGVV